MTRESVAGELVEEIVVPEGVIVDSPRAETISHVLELDQPGTYKVMRVDND